MKPTADKKLITSSDARSKAAFSAVGTVFGGYEPGFELVSGSHQNNSERASERFVVLSVRGVPRLLLPPELPAMRMALKSFLGNRQAAGLIPPLLKTAAQVGGPLTKLGSHASLVSDAGESSPLRELISGVLKRNDFQIALRLSFERPNGKIVALAISDAGEALCFAKFGSEAMTNELVAHESAILEQFETMDMSLITPPRLYSGTWAGGHNVLITSALHLERLKRDASDAHQAANAVVSQTFVSSSTLAASDYWRQVIERIGKIKNIGDSSEPLAAIVEKIEQKWGDSNFDFGVSHGDWTRANVGLVDGRVAALDWERCTKIAPRGIDIAHFAIYEKPFLSLKKSVDIDWVAENLRQYLKAADLPQSDAESLMIFAFLEMVIRFKSGRNAGIRSTDSKFGSALQAGLQKWAV